MVILAKMDRFQSAKAVNGVVQISDQTVRNRLHRANLYVQRPLVCPLLTLSHTREYLQFASQYQTIGLPDLRPILFSDESKFSFDFHDGPRDQQTVQ